MANHEQKTPSDRTFGFTLFFALLAVGLVFYSNAIVIRTSVSLAFVVLSISLFWPGCLHKFNVGWMALGRKIGSVSNPIFLGLIYLILLTPLGILRRSLGRGVLARKFQNDLSSYWMARTDPKVDAESLKRQF